MTIEEIRKLSSRITKKQAIDLLSSFDAFEIANYKLVGKYLINKYNKKPKKIDRNGFINDVRVFWLNGRPAINFNGKKTYLNRVVYSTFKGELGERTKIAYLDGDVNNNSLDNLEAQLWRKQKKVEKEFEGIQW